MKTLEINEKSQKIMQVYLQNYTYLSFLMPKSTKPDIKLMLRHSTVT